MAETVEFKSNGNQASGYLAKPASGSGPGVLVIQEWWGLDDSLKQMADRLADAGFVALAPDLYHGQVAGHTEMDKAAKLMQALPPDRAGRDMSGAVDYLAGHSAVTGASRQNTAMYPSSAQALNVTRPIFCMVGVIRNRGNMLPPSADIVRIRIVEMPESC